MKQREILQTGATNSQGGLSMYMQELNEFFKRWPNKKVIARFTIVDASTASEPMKAYYFNYVVPKVMHALWQEGDRRTEEKTEQFLRENSPIMWRQLVNPETGKYSSELKEIKDLSNSELVEHIEIVRQLAAENFAIEIEDPKKF